MNVTKDLLDKLGLVLMTISDGSHDFLCFLRKIEKDTLTFSLSSEVDFEKKKNTFLRITVNREGTQHFGSADFAVADYGENYCIGTIGKINGEKISDFFNELSAFETLNEKYGRRKENRFKIGKENCRKFGLLSPEQTLFLSSPNFSQPCAVLDASIHGICVITLFSSAILNEIDNFNIKISFVEPDETVVLKAHKVHSKLNRTANNVFVTLSCQLLEPINCLWKKRVIGMIENDQRQLDFSGEFV